MLKDAIQILLKQQQKTQKELCSTVGISDTGLRKIFARDSCETALLKKIAEFFNVSICYFFDEPSVNHAVASGDSSVAAINSSVEGSAVLKERVHSLEELVEQKDKLIEEKERTIKILMGKNG